jgi:hypothetical protein
MLLRMLLLAVTGLAVGFATARTASTQTPAAYSLTLTGPATARPGEEVTYVLRHAYSTTPPPRQVLYFFDTPQGTTFVSVDSTSGTEFAEALVGSESFEPSASDFAARTFGRSRVTLTFIPGANEGQSTIRLRIADDAAGEVQARARFGATGLGGSNEVVTTIASSRLPTTGQADNSGRMGWSAAPVVLALVMFGVLAGSALIYSAASMQRRH